MSLAHRSDPAERIRRADAVLDVYAVLLRSAEDNAAPDALVTALSDAFERLVLATRRHSAPPIHELEAAEAAIEALRMWITGLQSSLVP